LKNAICLTAFLGLILFLCGLLSPLYALQLNTGSGSFVFITPLEKKQIRVWYYKPEKFAKTSQIVFVMHGVKRNGQKYRDVWACHAKAKNFLLLVPEFSEKYYPGSAGYNLGNIFSLSGKQHDRKLWSYTVIENIFDLVKTLSGSPASAYSIYGHSAGAQFVSRLVMFLPQARVKKAIAANAGWYTMPDDDQFFPYGLKGLGPEIVKNVSLSFEKNLFIILGSLDTDENHRHLRKTGQAMKQGKHRLARGHSFYKKAQKHAQKENVQFNWKLREIMGAGHSNSKMSGAAVELLH
jgi:hypothetical protein